MPDLQYILPAGLVRLLNFRRRFGALGLPESYAYRQKYRKALEMSLLEMIPAEVREKPTLVVDVGANVGEWSIGVALLTGAKEIIAYEPVPDFFRELEKEAKAYPQIHCRNCALGATNGQVDMNVYEVGELSSILPLGDEASHVHGVSTGPTRKVQVPLTTLDSEIGSREEISLLKLDVQGYEPQVIAGAQRVLKRTRVLMMEVTYASYYRGDMQFQDLNALVTGLAPFRLWGISAPHCSGSRKPMWADAVYVNSRLAA